MKYFYLESSLEDLSHLISYFLISIMLNGIFSHFNPLFSLIYLSYYTIQYISHLHEKKKGLENKQTNSHWPHSFQPSSIFWPITQVWLFLFLFYFPSIHFLFSVSSIAWALKDLVSTANLAIVSAGICLRASVS